MTTWRDCGNPACRQCRWRRAAVPPDSGHPESLASTLLALAGVALWALAVVLMWAGAS